MTTTAVIGHGRSPEGAGWGPQIDAADRVVRMWDWHWEQPVDHGERYDVGLFEIHPQLYRERFITHNCRTPSDGWIGSLIKWRVSEFTRFERLTPGDLPAGTRVVDQAPWCAIGQALGGRGATGRLSLTRGAIAACWALETEGKGDTVVLVGFDNVAAGRALHPDVAFSPRYRAAPGVASFRHYRAGITKAGNHDLAIERPLLEHLANKRGVVLSFAQEVW